MMSIFVRRKLTGQHLETCAKHSDSESRLAIAIFSLCAGLSFTHKLPNMYQTVIIKYQTAPILSNVNILQKFYRRCKTILNVSSHRRDSFDFLYPILALLQNPQLHMCEGLQPRYHYIQQKGNFLTPFFISLCEYILAAPRPLQCTC